MNDRWILGLGIGALALAGIALVAVVASEGGDGDDAGDEDLPEVGDEPESVEDVFS